MRADDGRRRAGRDRPIEAAAGSDAAHVHRRGAAARQTSTASRSRAIGPEGATTRRLRRAVRHDEPRPTHAAGTDRTSRSTRQAGGKFDVHVGATPADAEGVTFDVLVDNERRARPHRTSASPTDRASRRELTHEGRTPIQVQAVAGRGDVRAQRARSRSTVPATAGGRARPPPAPATRRRAADADDGGGGRRARRPTTTRRRSRHDDGDRRRPRPPRPPPSTSSQDLDATWVAMLGPVQPAAVGGLPLGRRQSSRCRTFGSRPPTIADVHQPRHRRHPDEPRARSTSPCARRRRAGGRVLLRPRRTTSAAADAVLRRHPTNCRVLRLVGRREGVRGQTIVVLEPSRRPRPPIAELDTALDDAARPSSAGDRSTSSTARTTGSSRTTEPGHLRERLRRPTREATAFCDGDAIATRTCTSPVVSQPRPERGRSALVARRRPRRSRRSATPRPCVDVDDPQIDHARRRRGSKSRTSQLADVVEHDVRARAVVDLAARRTAGRREQRPRSSSAWRPPRICDRGRCRRGSSNSNRRRGVGRSPPVGTRRRRRRVEARPIGVEPARRPRRVGEPVDDVLRALLRESAPATIVGSSRVDAIVRADVDRSSAARRRAASRASSDDGAAATGRGTRAGRPSDHGDRRRCGTASSGRRGRRWTGRRARCRRSDVGVGRRTPAPRAAAQPPPPRHPCRRRRRRARRRPHRSAACRSAGRSGAPGRSACRTAGTRTSPVAARSARPTPARVVSARSGRRAAGRRLPPGGRVGAGAATALARAGPRPRCRLVGPTRRRCRRGRRRRRCSARSAPACRRRRRRRGARAGRRRRARRRTRGTRRTTQNSVPSAVSAAALAAHDHGRRSPRLARSARPATASASHVRTTPLGDVARVAARAAGPRRPRATARSP